MIKKAQDAEADIKELTKKREEAKSKKAKWTSKIEKITTGREAQEKAKDSMEKVVKSEEEAGKAGASLTEAEALAIEAAFEVTIDAYKIAIKEAENSGQDIAALTSKKGEVEMKKAVWRDKVTEFKRIIEAARIQSEEEDRLQTQKLEEARGLKEKAERSMRSAESLEKEHAIDSPSLTKIQEGAMESLLDAAITDYTAAIEKAQEVGQSIADLTSIMAAVQNKNRGRNTLESCWWFF